MVKSISAARDIKPPGIQEYNLRQIAVRIPTDVAVALQRYAYKNSMLPGQMARKIIENHFSESRKTE